MTSILRNMNKQPLDEQVEAVSKAVQDVQLALHGMPDSGLNEGLLAKVARIDVTVKQLVQDLQAMTLSRETDKKIDHALQEQRNRMIKLAAAVLILLNGAGFGGIFVLLGNFLQHLP